MLRIRECQLVKFSNALDEETGKKIDVWGRGNEKSEGRFSYENRKCLFNSVSHVVCYSDLAEWKNAVTTYQHYIRVIKLNFLLLISKIYWVWNIITLVDYTSAVKFWIKFDIDSTVHSFLSLFSHCLWVNNTNDEKYASTKQ